MTPTTKGPCAHPDVPALRTTAEDAVAVVPDFAEGVELDAEDRTALTRLIVFLTADNAALKTALAERTTERDEQHDIVARIWSMFGSPSYEVLTGRSIYDFVQAGLDAQARLREPPPAATGEPSEAMVEAACAAVPRFLTRLEMLAALKAALAVASPAGSEADHRKPLEAVVKALSKLTVCGRPVTSLDRALSEAVRDAVLALDAQPLPASPKAPVTGGARG